MTAWKVQTVTTVDTLFQTLGSINFACVCSSVMVQQQYKQE